MENSRRLQSYLYDAPYVKRDIKKKSTMTLENIPEGYTPLSNIIRKNDIEFSYADMLFGYNYCGVSTYRDNGVWVLCVKDEHISKLKDYFAARGMGEDDEQTNVLIEIDTIPDMFVSFKVEYGLNPEVLRNDPIMAKQVVDAYPSDRIKQLLKNRLFGTPIEEEWTTVDSIVATESENVPDELPF